MLLAALAFADEIHVAAMPAAAYDADDGFGLGARVELDQLAPGYAPYRVAWILHGFASLNGFQHHRFKFDATGLGPAHNLRLWGHFAYRQWANDGYWGMGNGTTVEREYLDVDPDSPERKRYRYSLIQPFGRLTLRWDATPSWGAFAYLSGRYTITDTYEGSVAEEEQPFGLGGGPGMQIGVGALYDTREPELTPDRGMLVEVAGRYSPPLPGGEGHFGGVFSSVRGFVPMGPRVVFGTRLMGDYLWGEIPFYDLITWGGLTPILGFGGSETVRGTNFGRWRAPGKIVSNNELRVDVGTHKLFGRDLRWQIVPFVDAGTVFGGGETAELPIHPSFGAGIHPIYDKTFAGRIDFASGVEMIREADGSISYEPSFGAYVVFDPVF